MSVTDDTIMPDGRPFVEWHYELMTMRRKEGEARDLMNEAKELMLLAGITTVTRLRDPANHDILISINASDLVHARDIETAYLSHVKLYRLVQGIRQKMNVRLDVGGWPIFGSPDAVDFFSFCQQLDSDGREALFKFLVKWKEQEK